MTRGADPPPERAGAEVNFSALYDDHPEYSARRRDHSFEQAQVGQLAGKTERRRRREAGAAGERCELQSPAGRVEDFKEANDPIEHRYSPTGGLCPRTAIDWVRH